MAGFLDGIQSVPSGFPTIWCNLLAKKINIYFVAREEIVSALSSPLAIKGIFVASISCPLCVAATKE